MDGDYYASRSLSHSKLSCLAQNPMEFKMRYVDNPPSLPPKESDAFAMGHAVHCLALEPEKFDERFVAVAETLSTRSTAGEIAHWLLDPNNEVMEFPWVCRPEGMERRTKAGQEEYNQWAQSCERSGLTIVDKADIDKAQKYVKLVKGKTVLDWQDHQDAIACVQALNNHAEFATIMAQPKRVEVPFEFDLFGHKFKAKPDAIIDSMKLIVDIKTTDDASPHRWQWSAVDYGYHRQAWLYQKAVNLEVGEWYRFVFAVVEKPKPSTRGIPPTVALYELDIGTVMMGREDVLTLLNDYERRLETNNWQQPYSSGIVPLRLPKRRVYSEE
jgi:hypothetical protein